MIALVLVLVLLAVERVEATRQWADARVKMRWGIPVASIVLIGAVVAGLALLA